MRSTLRLPAPDHYASGWYRFAYRYDFAPGDVRPLHLFGRDLVAFCGEDGQVKVLDAHCPHLGAHLGHGGIVVGNCVQCPFHGWQWDGLGKNQAIPNEPKPSPATIRSWRTVERDGICYLWFDQDDRDPDWEPGPLLPEGSADEYFLLDESVVGTWEGVQVYPQSIVENVADASHFKFIHGSGEIPDIHQYSVEGALFRSKFVYEWGAGYESTWLTPNGPIPSEVFTESWGLGIVITRYFGIPEMIQVTGATPIDGRTSVVSSALFVRRATPETIEIDPLRRRLVKHLLEQPEHDLTVWENMAILERPLFRRSEARIYTALREWAGGFYPSRSAAPASLTS
ncbi:Rieske 2Fe-2S domain-containing protein [Pseudonocardia xishanensis]|uniref:cholesterol 7-desaturase n=1 Tax=Pseudonocardia xishanensis TaxID=630995 RepID=A0ABP8RYN5_9PSEU